MRPTNEARALRDLEALAELDAEASATGGLSQLRIAEVLGISRARVSQIELAAMAKLRKVATRGRSEL